MTKSFINIKTACFLFAFAAVGAGFAFKAHLLERSLAETRRSYDNLTLSECAESLELLRESLSELLEKSNGDLSSALSDVRLAAELAKNSAGYIGFSNAGGEELFSFLTCVSLLSENALKLGIRNEATTEPESIFSTDIPPSISHFQILYTYASDMINDALPHLVEDQEEFEERLSAIFSDTLLETILYESGYGTNAPSSGFGTIGGDMIKEKDAKALARKHLGKNAYIDVCLTGSAFPCYNVSGRNISAVISAKSGILLQFLFDKQEDEINFDSESARGLSDKFMSETGFSPPDMECDYLGISSGLHIFRYTPITKNKILCLSESIKVGVSGGSGRICLYDATDYYKYRVKSQSIPQNILSYEDITAKYPSSSPVLCKVERTEGIESLCYRIEADGKELFISAVSGMRVDI